MQPYTRSDIILNMPKILLVDGYSILFRGFYALPLLTTPQGEYTNAVYGFMNIFLKLYEEEKPDVVAVALDLPQATFRHEKFAEYKGTRKPTPPEFKPQVPLLTELLNAMNIPILTCPGYEADDILGTLAKKIAENNTEHEVVIISGDRDLLQIASDNIKIRIPKTKGVEDYYAKDVIEKYGVTPAEYIDVKALMGDASDNIPGVPSIGEKTALKLIVEYKSVENAIQTATSSPDKVKPKKACQNLVEFADQAILSKELATIALDAPVEFNYTDALSAPPNNMWNEASFEVIKRLNFKTLLKRFSVEQVELEEINPEFELASYILNQPVSDTQEMRKLLEEYDQTYLYDEIELPLSHVLKDMTDVGIKVDKNALIAYGQVLDTQIDILTGEIYDLSGEAFNINSPAQLGVILFEKLGLTGTKKTKSGYSTAADVLEKLKNKHPIVEKVLTYRTHAKLKSTYVDGLLPLIDPSDSRIRSTFKQTLTATGRISSAEPNLQNIPVRMPIGRKLRKVFVPEDGYIFIDADYSQIELRVLAHMSGDDALINAFHDNQDIHSLTASQVFATPIAEVQPYQRHAAKAVNFGIVYGISAFGLSEDLNISRKEAEMYIAGYFRQYPKVKQFMDDTIQQAKEDGYVKTIFNRRRPIPELASKNFALRSFGERAAMNMPIQGTAADIIKIAMVRTAARLKNENFASRLILQVHDELLIEAKLEEKDDVKKLLKEEMENAASLAVPLSIDIHEGASWYDVK